MSPSGHTYSFKVKQQTAQLKMPPNVTNISWSTWSTETFIFGLISNCKISIIFCDIQSACLKTYLIINTNINIRQKQACTSWFAPSLQATTVQARQYYTTVSFHIAPGSSNTFPLAYTVSPCNWITSQSTQSYLLRRTVGKDTVQYGDGLHWLTAKTAPRVPACC